MKFHSSYSIHINLIFLTLNMYYFTADGKVEKNTLLDYIKAFPGKSESQQEGK